MSELHHLIVEHGSEKGKKIFVPPDGARMGRSSKNDIVLVDPLLSRHHCRLFFKPGQGLWIADLGSANQCLVNDKPAQEQQLHVGDSITAGATTLKVVDNGLGPEDRKEAQKFALASTPPPAVPPQAGQPQQRASIDLGLRPNDKPAQRKIGIMPLAIIAVAVVAIALGVWVPKILKTKAPAQKQQPEGPPTLEIDYEKVTASSANIFRYQMKLTKNHLLAIRIDDVENDRHLPKEKPVDPAYLEDITRVISESGFFDLAEEYKGSNPDVLEQWTLRITIGRKTHQTRVTNRVPPENLEGLIKTLEEFGRNELGIWAIQYPREKLLSMAQNSYLNGKKLHDEKEVKYDNLANAVRNLQEAEIYLETVDPKPDYYAEIITLMKDYKQELQEKYEDQNFKVERATNLKQWEEAANELRILLELIPDRSDPRNLSARKKLLDVERRLDRKD